MWVVFHGPSLRKLINSIPMRRTILWLLYGITAKLHLEPTDQCHFCAFEAIVLCFKVCHCSCNKKHICAVYIQCSLIKKTNKKTVCLCSSSAGHGVGFISSRFEPLWSIVRFICQSLFPVISPRPAPLCASLWPSSGTSSSSVSHLLGN